MIPSSDTPSTAQLEDRLRELEANLERLAERLNRLERAVQ
jgi:ubiquinone biosynthesis protein UbiJ